VILAGGFSKRFGQDKGSVRLAGKPLILYVVDVVSKLVDDIVVVANSKKQREAFADLFGRKAVVAVDKYEKRSPLVGALTGFEKVQGDYSLLLPCDTPFVSSQIASLLLDLCVNRNAAVPRWPNGYIEPLQAVYHTKSALAAAEKAVGQDRLELRSMIANLSKVRYVSTTVLRQVNPKLLTFFNVNTPEDLKKAESILKRIKMKG